MLLCMRRKLHDCAHSTTTCRMHKETARHRHCSIGASKQFADAPIVTQDFIRRVASHLQKPARTHPSFVAAKDRHSAHRKQLLLLCDVNGCDADMTCAACKLVSCALSAPCASASAHSCAWRVQARQTCISSLKKAHPSLAYTRGQSGSVASATTKVCRRLDSTCVNCAAGRGCKHKEPC